MTFKCKRGETSTVPVSPSSSQVEKLVPYIPLPIIMVIDQRIGIKIEANANLYVVGIATY
jgi:hypothetical protein